MPLFWFVVVAALLVVLLLGSGVVIGFSLARQTPGSGASTTRLHATATSVPSPTPVLCDNKAVLSGPGLSMDVTLMVPEGCDVIMDAVQGQINGLSWGGGGVLAFPSGSYTGYIIDGDYQLFVVALAEVKFCQRYKTEGLEGHTIAYTHPLDEWNDWKSVC